MAITNVQFLRTGAGTDSNKLDKNQSVDLNQSYTKTKKKIHHRDAMPSGAVGNGSSVNVKLPRSPAIRLEGHLSLWLLF